MKKLLYSLSFVIATVLLIESCTKIRTTQLGGGLIPAVDNVNVFDTTMEVLTTAYELPDSTRISSTALHAFGLLEDPVFGKTTAEIYLQLEPSTFSGYPFGSVPDSIIGLDSVILSLRYNSVYGDTNSIQSFKVYEIDQSAPFTDTSLGYLISHPTFQLAQQIGEKLNVPFHTLNDSLTYIRVKDTVKTVNELRIPLTNEFGMKLINIDTATYNSKKDSAFEKKFRGLAIVPDAGSSVKKALAYFNIADAEGTKISFHYRRTRNGAPDTTITTFIYNSADGSYTNRGNANLIYRDVSGTPYETMLQNGANNSQQELYLQSTPGSYSLLKIPGLQALNNRVIYKAALIMEPLEGNEEASFPAPGLLFLDAVDSANSRFITVPNSWVFQQNSSPLFYDPGSFGGFLLNKKIEFDLSAYVQGIVTRKEKSYALRLFAPYSTRPVISPSGTNQTQLQISNRVAAGRVVVGGGAHPTKKLRLYLVYSRL
ncbi:DUF4270 family protein [Flavihumibacter sp. CACIAM 22H1]|uniref:DUF4270 family protein n=1 Tax=Flavihumibacter sp. CACIAM 22H1 TaxID=1812911 RepID=UPI0007A8894F|nr:DUF4270 family protein [Flavihumibacter sp. CACIAM 22H1]KYP14966.1 MAG: hypothetical protein A1D16_16805 [Flavihumibacter sp. CACIAM 22H1]